MHVHLRNSFLSLGKDQNEPDRWLVRACLKGDIERVFPDALVVVRHDTRFRYRAFVSADEVARQLGPHFSLEAADEPSIAEAKTRYRAGVYAEETMLKAQRREPFPIAPGERMCVLRKDWQISGITAQTATVELDIPVSPDAFDEFVLGLRPEQMEDKWFIYFEDPYLYCHRSWTGYLSCRFLLVPWRDRRKIVEAMVHLDKDFVNWTDPVEGARACLDALMVTILRVPPDSDGPDAAVENWGAFGHAMLGGGPMPGIEYRPPDE